MSTLHKDSLEKYLLFGLDPLLYVEQLRVIFEQLISHRFGPFKFEHNSLGWKLY